METAACVCEKALQHAFTSVRESLLGQEEIDVHNSCDLVATHEVEFMHLYRCRTCGRFWVEGCYTSGHATVYYLYPVPQTDDPLRWFHQEAQELPWEAVERTQCVYNG